MSSSCTLCPEPSTTELDNRPLCAACAERVQTYTEKLTARHDRLKASADKAYETYQADYDHAHTLAQALPFGQPILIGHHSESRDRRYRAKIESTYRRAFEHYERSKTLAKRAEAAEDYASIRSDDPLAIQKLQEKIAADEAELEGWKTINARIRATRNQPYDKRHAALVALGMTEGHATHLLHPDNMGIRKYQIDNRAANIRRMKERLADLQAKQAAASAPDFVREEMHGTVKLVRNVEANRLQLIFPGKPSTEVIKALKSRGFVWSGGNGAWQRQLNNAAEHAAEMVLKDIGMWQGEE